MARGLKRQWGIVGTGDFYARQHVIRDRERYLKVGRQTMASAERNPQRDPRAEPLVNGSGIEAP